MTFSATEHFANKPVAQWSAGEALPDTATTSIKLAVDPYGDGTDYASYFEQFTKLEGIDNIESLIIGSWGEAYEENSSLPIKLLVQNNGLFPALTSLFIGDLSLEEAEVSWIQQSDVSTIYQAFPKLELLKIRGGEGLSLGNLSHSRINTLVIETGGMGKNILEQARLANLPELTHLELWLGDENYGCDISSSDLRAFLNGLSTQFPKLSYLGLRNYYQSDELAAVISELGAPENISTLDLSNGNISDKGAEALLNTKKLSHLKILDLHHHYLSDEMMAKLTAAKLADSINLDDQNQADEYDDETYRYIFVSE